MNWKLQVIPLVFFVLQLTGCASLVDSPSDPPLSGPVAEPTTPERPSASSVELLNDSDPDRRAEPVILERDASGRSAELDTPEKMAELDTPEKAAELDTPEKANLPYGTAALFTRVSLGEDSHSQPTGHGTVRWETGSRGIMRYLPVNDSYQVIKTASTSSYSPSAIYPITVGNRLFSIRDWGADWTAKNKRFSIEELDPVTGDQLSTMDLTAEWFTILGDHVYFQSEIVEDFWGGPPSGGHLMVKSLGDRTTESERKLAVRGFRFHAVGEELVSLEDGQVHLHDPRTGKIRSSASIPSNLLKGRWPDSRSVFFGEEAIYWAATLADPHEIHIIKMPLDGVPKSIISFTLEGHETGLVIDDSSGALVVGVVGPAPPNGLGIIQVFMIDQNDGSTVEIPVDRYIPAARLEAGGGLQLLKLHPD